MCLFPSHLICDCFCAIFCNTWLLFGCRILNSIDEALHLSDVFGIEASDPAVLLLLVVFSNVWQLVDATLDDERLLEFTPDKSSRWLTTIQDIEIDDNGHFLENRSEHREAMLKSNTSMAFEMIVESLQSKVTLQIFFLVRQNM